MNTTDSLQSPTAYPTLKQSWILLGITLLITLAFMIIVLLINLVLMALDLSELGQMLITGSLSKLVLYTLPFVVVLLIAFGKKRKFEPTFQLRWNFVSPTPFFLITLITLLIYFLVDPLIELIPMPRFFERLILEVLGDRSLPAIIMLVVAAPLCEELLFRGIILDGLYKHYSPVKAIVWSAVFFGLVHLNPWQFIAALALGIFMGWIYTQTRSILTTIYIHFLANATGFILGLFLVPESNNMVPTRDLIGNDLLYLGLLGVDLIVLIFAVVSLNTYFQKQK